MGRHYSAPRPRQVPPVLAIIGIQTLMMATILGVLVATALYFLLFF